jgi:hypothetical protein
VAELYGAVLTPYGNITPKLDKDLEKVWLLQEGLKLEDDNVDSR